jgi:5-methylcytosine-specific restriction protein A
MSKVSIRQLREAIERLPSGPARVTAGNEYRARREQWLAWLRDYHTPGYYGRQTGTPRDARHAYNHLIGLEMLLWLAEAAGISASQLTKARAAARVAPSPQAKSAAVRKIIPWETIKTALWQGDRTHLRAPAPSAYLLTWNPKKFDWTDLKGHVRKIRAGRPGELRWSCGNTKRIQAGDRIFLLRQGLEPRGIMASGTALGAPDADDSWDAARRTALYVPFQVDMLLDPEVDGVLPLSQLQDGPLGEVNWRTQSSGISIPDDAAAELEKRWRAFLAGRGQRQPTLPEEVASPASYYEGAVKEVTVNAYERDAKAREAAIAHHGFDCKVCGFDFESAYGKHGEGYIHVHHQVPLSTINKRYKVDPVKDLVPVCPNCHAMLHRGSETLTVAQLRSIMKKAGRRGG